MPVEIEPEEGELSEVEDDEAEAEELERESEERREEASEEVREAMSRLSGEGKSIRINIEILTQNFPAAERATKPERATDPEEYAEDEDNGKEKKKKNTKAVEATLKEAAGEEEGASEEEKEKSEKKKTSNLQKFLVFFAGVYALGPDLKALFEALTRLGKGESISDLIKGGAMQAQLVALAQAWKDEPDEKYWTDFAGFVERQKASIAEIVYFMQYTMLFSALDKNFPFAWHSWADETKQVEELVELLKEKDKTKGDLIETLPTIEYDDAAVPRYIQASLGQQAFSRVLQDAKEKPDDKD